MMAQITVRNLEDDIRDRLHDRAQRHGWSMEEEIRDILRAAVVEPEAGPQKLGTWCVDQFSDEAFDEVFSEWRGCLAR